MLDKLEKQLDREKLEHLIMRIREVYDNGALKIRDWMGIYNLLIDACERERAATVENILIESLNGDDFDDEAK